jgi:hypothetical protein
VRSDRSGEFAEANVVREKPSPPSNQVGDFRFSGIDEGKSVFEVSEVEVSIVEVPARKVPVRHRLAGKWIQLIYLARRAAPAVVVDILNIFR